MTVMTAINGHGSSLNHHILSVLVQNRPGVLARVASLFARRGYNIYSLAVAPAEDEGMSRITIVRRRRLVAARADREAALQADRRRQDQRARPASSVERELLLVTVRATAESRHQVVELCGIFEGKILAVGA
jgi:acetolactate synthase I/III small subunit